MVVIDRQKRINNYLSKKYKKRGYRRTKLKNKNKNKKKVLPPCNIINVHGEKITLPYSYPGIMWVHIFLNPDRHYPMESFSSDYFLKLYKKARVKCYGK